MIFKGEALKERYSDIENTYSNLQQLQQRVFEIDELIKKKDMQSAKEKIIEVSQNYLQIFYEINKLIEKYT